MKKTVKKQKSRVGRGKPKGKPPASLQKVPHGAGAGALSGRGGPKPVVRKKKRAPKAVAPPPRELGLLEAIGEALADVNELGDEMRQWADGMPDSLQSGQKHDEVEEAADTLEDQAANDPIDDKTDGFLNSIKIMVQDPMPKRTPYSRSARLGHATSILNQVMEMLGDEDLAIDGAKLTKEQRDRADEVHEALEEIESSLQGVEFPSMFG